MFKQYRHYSVKDAENARKMKDKVNRVDEDITESIIKDHEEHFNSYGADDWKTEPRHVTYAECECINTNLVHYYKTRIVIDGNCLYCCRRCGKYKEVE